MLECWNVARLKNKNKKFWKYIENFDVGGVVETEIMERECREWKKRLSEEFEWESSFAVKKTKQKDEREEYLQRYEKI